MERVAGVIKGIEPNDSPERFRGLGVDVIFGDGRFVGRRRVRSRRPPAHREDLRHRHRLAARGAADSRPRRDALSHQRDAVRSARAGARAHRRRRRADRLRDGAGVPPPGQRRHRRRHRAADPAARGRRSRRRRAAHAASRRRSLSPRRHRSRRCAGRDRRRAPDGARADGTTTRARRDRTCCWPPAARANVEGLGLDAAGVRVDHGRIVADDATAHDQSATSTSSATPPAATSSRTSPSTTPASSLRQAIFRMRWAKPSPVVPWCTFTDPELARVGLSEAEASERGVAHRGLPVRVRRHRPRARRRRDRGLRRRSSPIRRASCWAPRSSVRTPASSSPNTCSRSSKGMNAKELSGVIHTYPTLAQINRRVADQRLKEGLTPSSKTWIQRIFGLQGAWHDRPMRRAQRAARWRCKSRCSLRFVGVVVAFFALGGQRYLSLDTVKAQPRRAARASPTTHYVAALAIAFLVYVGATAFSLPGGLVLSLTMGFLFGRWVGTVLVVVAATIGATLVFLAARYLFADAARTPHGRARREDQRRLHRERVQLPAVPAPRPAVSVLPRQPRAGVHAISGCATFVVGDVHRHHSRDVRLREPRRDARAHRFAVGLVSTETIGAFVLLGLLALVPVFVRKWRSARAAKP